MPVIEHIERAEDLTRLAPVPHDWTQLSEAELAEPNAERVVQRSNRVAQRVQNLKESSGTSPEDGVMMRRFCLDDGNDCAVFDVLPELSDFIDPDFARGWLCFERRDERRRLAPIPDNWENLPDRDLSNMWARAQQVPRIQLGSTL